MGTLSRTDPAGITENLVTNGPSYNVWQAIRIGEILTKKQHPQRKDYLFDQSGLFFRPFENYDFPPTDIKSITCQEGMLTYVITFLGLYGINSPLPRCYHDQVSIQQRLMGSEDVPLKNFLDIFNNRFYWLYYQAWKKYRYQLHIGEEQGNKVSQRINSFIGRGFSAPGKENFVSDYTLLKFSGVLTRRSRNKAGLLMILGYMFPRYKISIKEFLPRWIEISDAPALGAKELRLGINSFIGKYALDYMSRIGIEIEPLSFEEYLEFLPGSGSANMLSEIMDAYLNDGLEYDVSFKIKSDTITSIQWNNEKVRLGSTIWLGIPNEEYTEVKINYEEFVKS